MQNSVHYLHYVTIIWCIHFSVCATCINKITCRIYNSISLSRHINYTHILHEYGVLGFCFRHVLTWVLTTTTYHYAQNLILVLMQHTPHHDTHAVYEHIYVHICHTLFLQKFFFLKWWANFLMCGYLHIQLYAINSQCFNAFIWAFFTRILHSYIRILLW